MNGCRGILAGCILGASLWALAWGLFRILQ